MRFLSSEPNLRHVFRGSPVKSSPRKHTFHRRPYQKYVDTDLAAYFRQADELNSIRACAAVNKHLSRTQLTTYHKQWVKAGRPLHFYKSETRGRKPAFTAEVRLNSYLAVMIVDRGFA
jgi:hypothetical protein